MDSGGHPESRSDQVRKRLRWVRAFLWGLVAVSAVMMWRAKRNGLGLDEFDPDPEISTKQGTGDKAGSDRKPIVLRPRVETPRDQPIWDPNGVEDFSLTERSGKTITKADLLGRPWVAGFIFTTCAGPCLTVTGQMSQLQQALAETDVRLVTFTVLPEVDTPPVLQKYADAFGADADRWLFLTGKKEVIYHLIQSSFLMPVQEVTGANRMPGWEVVHTTNLMYVDEKGVVRGKYDGKDPEAVAKLVSLLTSGPAEAELPTDATANGAAAGLPENRS